MRIWPRTRQSAVLWAGLLLCLSILTVSLIRHFNPAYSLPLKVVVGPTAQNLEIHELGQMQAIERAKYLREIGFGTNADMLEAMTPAFIPKGQLQEIVEQIIKREGRPLTANNFRMMEFRTSHGAIEIVVEDCGPDYFAFDSERTYVFRKGKLSLTLAY